MLWFELTYQGGAEPAHLPMMIDRAARLAMAWAMVLLALNLAERRWNRDHPWRATLAEAAFPLYLVHQGAIVLIAWSTLAWGWPAWAEALLLVGGTLAVAAGFYLGGRRIGWLRPLIGLAPRPHAPSRRPLPAL